MLLSWGVQLWHLKFQHKHKEVIKDLKPSMVPGKEKEMCCSWPVPVFQEWMIRTKSRLKILKILCAAPSNSTTSISSNGNWINPSLPLEFHFSPSDASPRWTDIKLPFPFSALKVWKDATTYTTWLQSPWSHPTAPCGTRLSPSPASRWRKCCRASLWSERSRRSSAPVRRTWAKRRGLDWTGRTQFFTHWLLTMQYPSQPCTPQHPGFCSSLTTSRSFNAKGNELFFLFFFAFFKNFLPLPFSSSGGRCFFPLTAFVKPLSLKLDSQEGVSHHWWTVTVAAGLLSVPVSKSYQCARMLHSLLDLHIRLTSPLSGWYSTTLFIYRRVCFFLFCIDNILDHLWTHSKLKNLCLFSNTWFILVNDGVTRNSQIHMVKCYYSQVKVRDGRKFANMSLYWQ